MQSLELPFTEDTSQIEKLVESLGLQMQEMGTKQYAGGRHWHIRKPIEKGTLELTWWPKERRMWLSWRSNRMGNWIEETAVQIQKTPLK
ncbi:MAG: hypothetical protein KF836_13435 [Fimbriimonadaceae bacterium]|nr:hypothetical protein [Fimbriimonadaceae bacterium]